MPDAPGAIRKVDRAGWEYGSQLSGPISTGSVSSWRSRGFPRAAMIVRITAIGDVAQLAAQDLCKVEVEGSSPFVSTGPTTAATRRLPRMGPFSNDQQDLRARVSRLEEEVAELFKLVRGLQATGEPESRARQIELVMIVGRALDRHTRSRLLRASLKAMRNPARAAGMGALQGFLEAGFEAFAAMGGAHDFLAAIEAREQALAQRLFDPAAPAAAASPTPNDVLAQLP